MASARPRTNVYIDAFNLYYRLRGSSYKWLDLGKLCKLLLPTCSINRIRYFTAIVESRPDDPQQQQRQQAYIRALKTIPNLTPHYGSFLTKAVRLPYVNPPPVGPRTAEVWRTEEKGSDVNLATYLLLDGFQNDYEQAIVISHDSDLKEPIQVARAILGKRVGVAIPTDDTRFRRGHLPADFYCRIRPRLLAICQFPTTMPDKDGTITKPASW